MKEYIFRGKKNTDNRWMEGSLIQWAAGEAQIVVPGREYGKMVAHGVIPETVGMFTGLIDCGGKKIFQGDLVSHHKRMYEVAINFNGYYLLSYRLWRGEFVPSFSYSMCLITKPLGDRGEKGGVVESAEVIGNIWDNPELVKQLKA